MEKTDVITIFSLANVCNFLSLIFFKKAENDAYTRNRLVLNNISVTAK